MALVTVETVVTHADATSFVSVMVVKRTMLTSCPTVICDVDAVHLGCKLNGWKIDDLL